MKLLGSVPSPYTRKVRIVLAEKKIDCDFEVADVNPPDNPVNALNPLGKVPTLVLDDGTALFDSRVIVEFLDSVSPISRLIPDDNRERFAVRRWEALADGALEDKPWYHGDRYTLADIAVGCCLGWVEFRKPGGVEWRGEYPNLARFYDKLMERPAFADTAPK